jgi:hypothetical protein
MSALDVQALEANFTSWRNERVPHLSSAKAFERYAVEQALKDADLSDDEVESGLFGGPLRHAVCSRCAGLFLDPLRQGRSSGQTGN